MICGKTSTARWIWLVVEAADFKLEKASQAANNAAMPLIMTCAFAHGAYASCKSVSYEVQR